MTLLLKIIKTHFHTFLNVSEFKVKKAHYVIDINQNIFCFNNVICMACVYNFYVELPSTNKKKPYELKKQKN